MQAAPPCGVVLRESKTRDVKKMMTGKQAVASVVAALVISAARDSLFAETTFPNSQTSNPPVVTVGADSSYSSSSLGERCPGINNHWEQYIAPGREFAIEYPSTTHPERPSPDDLNLASRTVFKFEQRFDTGGVRNKGFIDFEVEISVWQNPHRQTAEAWATQHANPHFTSHAGPSQVANREGYTLRQSDLASWHVKTFVAANDRMYELAYLDVYTDNELFPTITRLVGKPFWIR